MINKFENKKLNLLKS